MTSQTTCKVNQLSENIDFLTLRHRISNNFGEIVNLKRYQKSQNLTNYGVENLVAMATSHTLDKKFLRNLVLQYILVKVAKLRRYCINSKEVLEG